MNPFDQYGGAFGGVGLLLLAASAFSEPLSEIERAARITARGCLGLILVIWLTCIAEQAQGGL